MIPLDPRLIQILEVRNEGDWLHLVEYENELGNFGIAISIDNGYGPSLNRQMLVSYADQTGLPLADPLSGIPGKAVGDAS